MSRLEGRADRLYPNLTAKERAVLVLQAANEGREVDFRLRWMMPEAQEAEFNAYMAQLRVVSQHVAPYILVLAEEISHANTKAVLLGVLCSWGADRSEFVNYIGGQTDEPCTQEEFDEHLAEARAEGLPLDFAVDAIMEARDLWADEPEESPAAQTARFRRLAKPIEAEVRQLVAEGRLDAHGRGAALTVQAGSLFEWLGRPVPVAPEWGREYRVLPAEDVDWRRESRESVRAQADAGPHSPLRVLEHLPPSPAWLLPDEDMTEHDRLMRALAERVHLELVRLAGALGAVDVVIEESREAFEGVDPAPPMLREVLEAARGDLARACKLARALVGDFSIPERDESVLEQLRGLPKPSGW